VGLIDRPDPGLQNLQKNECSANFVLTKIRAYGNRIAGLYGDCIEPGCTGKLNTNNSPAPTDLTENHDGGGTLIRMATDQKSATVVAHLRDARGGC
jgi:hypothetical protein